MLVCHCMRVNERQLLDEVLCGAIDPAELAARCGAGTRCGGCRPMIATLLERSGLVGQPAT